MDIWKAIQTGEGIEQLEQQLMDLDSTFKFKCRRCGKCCKNQDTILFSPWDIFRIGKKVGKSPATVIKDYTEVYVGPQTRIPVGRMYDFRDSSFRYFLNAGSCHPGQGPGRTWTLDEWLAEFNIRETESMTLAWNKLITALTKKTSRMREEEICGELYEALRQVMYLGYDTSLPYIDQVESRMDEAQKIFGKR